MIFRKSSDGFPAMKNSTMSNFEILWKLSEASFGTIFKVRRKADKTVYAIRQLEVFRMNPLFKAPGPNELKRLSSLENPYILKCYDILVEKNLINIIMEFCEGGDLGSFIKTVGQAITWTSNLEVFHSNMSWSSLSS